MLTRVDPYYLSNWPVQSDSENVGFSSVYVSSTFLGLFIPFWGLYFYFIVAKGFREKYLRKKVVFVCILR